jgi:hypothetical protein
MDGDLLYNIFFESQMMMTISSWVRVNNSSTTIWSRLL